MYLLYAHVRLTSIIRNSGVDVDELATSAADILALEHPSEIKLTKVGRRRWWCDVMGCGGGEVCD